MTRQPPEVVLTADDPLAGSGRRLAHRVGLLADGSERAERIVLDTFDWRVWGASGLLEHEDGPLGASLSWRDRDKGEVLARQPSDAVPVFSADVAPGPVRQLLEPVLDVRALIPRARGHVDRNRYRLVNEDEKTVARVTIERSKLGEWVVASAVRGYDADHRQLVDRLRQEGLRPAACPPALAALAVAGEHPGDHMRGFRPELSADMSASHAYGTVCSVLLATIEANEPELRRPRDTEFLHDYRVAVRRTRTLVSQARGVFPEAIRRSVADDLRWIAGLTSSVRDLDVWLLSFDGLAAMMPEGQGEDLEPLRGLLTELHRAEHEALLEGLSSARYRDLLDRWRSFVTDPSSDETSPEATSPVCVVASHRIRRAHRAVTRGGSAISDEDPPEAFHDLRKRAKKLRYLLESFRSLYPPDVMAGLITELKRVQDNLGDLQDSTVQTESLRRFGELLEGRPGSARALLAMGVLSERLQRRGRAARGAFSERFERFDGPANRKRFQTLVR